MLIRNAQFPDTNGDKLAIGDKDTYSNWHHYEINWTPRSIQWSVDGVIMRTLLKESTWNATANRYEYPQTPSRMQLSLWPAGRATNAQGTIDWAGGQIDWDAADIQDQGHYSASFANISMQCYEPPAGSVNGHQSYSYVDNKGLESSVRITKNDTVLPDMGHTGLNMHTDDSSATSDDGNSSMSTSGITGSVEHKSNAPAKSSDNVWLVAVFLLVSITVLNVGFVSL